MKEGLHLNGKGLRLLMTLEQIDRQIATMTRLNCGRSEECATLVKRRNQMMIEARSHCAQAGIPWDGFMRVLIDRNG